MRDSLFSKTFVALMVAMCSMVGFTGCTEKEEELNGAYGYVQFRLFKDDAAPKKSATRADNPLEYLSDACKVGVSLERPDGSVIEQTLVLRSYNAENAAYGMRSDKLQLLVGEYVVTGYTLYDYKDHGFKKEDGLSLSFTVVEDGLVYRDLSVDVVPRGKASFRLVKPEEFTAQRPFKGIEETAFSMKEASEPLKVVNVLCIQIQHKHGFLTKGIHLHSDVNQPHQCCRQKEAPQQIFYVP